MDGMISTGINVHDVSASCASGEARLEECEALRDVHLERGAELPPDLLEVIAHQRAVHMLDPDWVDLEALAAAEDQLRGLLSEGTEPEKEIAATDGEGRPNGGLLGVIRPQIVELFHSHDHEPYASIRVNGAIQVHTVQSEAFRRWLASAAYKARGTGATNNTIDALVQTLAAEALFDGVEHNVFIRVGEHDGAVYIDLGGDDGSAVKLEGGSWVVVSEPPAKFWRPASAQALPIPRTGGSVDLLWKYVNVDDADRPVVLAWLLAALAPRGPYPILAIQGEQGTAKSSAARVLKRLTDPSKAELRSMPSNETELANAASHAHVLALDNLSRLSADMSDAMCRLSTGGGVTRRKLYSDNDEIVLEVQVPVILTSIPDVITRPDLADRTYHVRPPYIEPADRRKEGELKSEFEQDAPLIFGALLDALAMALDRVGGVTLSESPRLADAACLAEAAAASFGLAPGDMEQALAANAKQLGSIQLEPVPFIRPLVDMSVEQDWDLTMSELLAQLDARANFDERKDSAWPSSTKRLAQELERLAPVLRREGIEITRYKTPGSNSQRMNRIRRTDR